MKDTLFWNQFHQQLRIAQGVPQPVPVYPNANATSQEILDFTTDTIFHVAHQNGAKEAVHLFVSSPVECTIFVRIISSSLLAANGTKTRMTNFPTTIDAMTFKIRLNQASATPVLQGYVISNSAAVSIFASVPGAHAFGFIVKE